MDEWIGRFVRLRETMRTSGGTVLVKGEPMVVTGHHRGKLTLNRPARVNAVRGSVHDNLIRGVRRDDVELLPKKPHKILQVMIEGMEALAESCGGVLAYETEKDGQVVYDVFRPKKLSMFQSVTAGSGIERDEAGLPKALALG